MSEIKSVTFYVGTDPEGAGRLAYNALCARAGGSYPITICMAREPGHCEPGRLARFHDNSAVFHVVNSPKQWDRLAPPKPLGIPFGFIGTIHDHSEPLRLKNYSENLRAMNDAAELLKLRGEIDALKTRYTSSLVRRDDEIAKLKCELAQAKSDTNNEVLQKDLTSLNINLSRLKQRVRSMYPEAKCFAEGHLRPNDNTFRWYCLACGLLCNS